MRIWLTICLILFSVSARAQSTNPQSGSIHVLASSSMVDILPKLAREFSAKERMTVAITFDNPDVLLEAIESGDQANLVITEDPVLMKSLKQKGLIDVKSISVLARDELVVAAKRDENEIPEPMADNALSVLSKLSDEKSLFVLANPNAVPMGTLGKAVLERLDMWDTLEPYTIQPPTAQQTRYQIEQDNGAGILYRSMAEGNESMDILAELPDATYDPIYYQTAVVGGQSMTGGRSFLEFLKSDNAKALFASHGFQPISQ